MKGDPKFELMQAVQLRGRYGAEAEARRGLVTDMSFSEPPGPGWVYSIQWGDKPDEESCMMEDDIEPASLILKP